MQQKNASRRKPQSSAPAGRTAAARPARSAQPADRAQAELRPLPGLAYGVLIKELRLLARAIFVLDKHDVVRYVEIVPEATTPPDYDSALGAARKLL